MSEFIRRLKYLLNLRQHDAELQDEMEFHREMAARNGGVPLGNTLRLREESRDEWGWTWMEHLAQDVRYAVRQLKRTPGFTLAALLMLSLGIGVNIGAFGFFNLMILRPLPVRDAGTLLRFKRRAPQSFASLVPYPEMTFFREYSKTLSAVLAASEGKLSMEGEENPLTASFVTANLFSELGGVPTAGRFFEPSEVDAEPVVVLSQGFWRRHFAGNLAVVGQTIRLNNKPATIIGVAGSEFSGLSMDDPALWLPLTQQPYFFSGSTLLTDFSVDGPGVTMFGRLKPGLAAAAAEGELSVLAKELHARHPEDIWEKETLPSSPAGFARNLGGGRHGTGREGTNEAYPVIALVGTLVLLILVVACGNLGSLLLARGVNRDREISVRVALGAGTGRLIRQLFTESLLLAMAGTAAGAALGYLLLKILLAVAKAPAWLNPLPDWRVLAFATAIGCVAAVLFGLAPAVQVARQQHRKNRMRQFLIAGQVAASCVLLIVAALLVRAIQHALSSSPGFAYQEVVSIDPGMASHGYTAARARAYLDVLQNRLRAIPGIESVSATASAPLGNKKVTTGADIAGRSIDVHMYAVDPQFLGTMKIPMLQGRNLMRGDTHAIVISKSFARQWPTGDPLGRPFQMGADKYTVVGVCGSARLVALEDSDAVETYYLAGDSDMPSMVVVARAAGSPEGLVPYIRNLAGSIDPKIFPQVELMKTSFQRKMEGSEYAAMTVSALGLMALLLACLGIVGLVSYAVSQRTREIGIRMALGAQPKEVLSVVMRELRNPIAGGLLAGVAAAAALSQVLRRQLFGISSLDAPAYLAAIGLFIGIVCIASLLPARRALRVDPSQSLRCE